MPEHDATDPTAPTGKATWQARVDPGDGAPGGAGAPGAAGGTRLPTWQQTPRATPPPMGRPAPLRTSASAASALRTSTSATSTSATSAPATSASATPAAAATAPAAPASQATASAPAAAKAASQPVPRPSAGSASAGTNGSGTAGGPSAPAGSPAAPTSRAGRVRARLGTKLRRWRLPLAAVLPCLVLAGVGWWCWPTQPAPVPLHLVAGTVHAALVTPDEASRLTGMSLTSGPRAGRPAPALAATPANCGIAVGPSTQAVFGKEWTAFLSATYQDAGGLGDYTMTQVAGVYPDSGKAAGVLRALTAGLRSCPSAVRTDQNRGSSRWTYRVDDTAPDSVAWTAVQDGGDGWACYRQARLKGTSLLQVGICEAGDARSTVQAVIQRLTAGVDA
jgi:PknH-like extracellular domain